MSIEEIERFAIAKQKEARSEMNGALQMQEKYGQVFDSAVREAQRALRTLNRLRESNGAN